MLFGGSAGDVFFLLSRLSSSLFPPFGEDSCQTRELLGGRARVKRGNRETDGCFLELMGGVSAQSSLHLVDFKPCGEFTRLGSDSFFFLTKQKQSSRSSNTLMLEMNKLGEKRETCQGSLMAKTK